MKKKLLTLGILGMVLSLTNSLSAQEIVQQKVMNENGGVSLVVFNPTSNLNEGSVKGIFQDVLKLRSNEEMRLLKSQKDVNSDFTDAKYQLYQRNIKVEGAIYNLHYKAGKLVSMNGEIFQDDRVSTNPGITANIAFQAAVKSVGAEKYMWEDADYVANNEYKKPAGELVFIPMSQGEGKYSLILAYKFDIYAAQPISRDYIYVDASNGRIVMVDAIMKHAKKENYNSKPAPITVEPFAATSQNFVTLVAGNAATRYSGDQVIQTTLAASGKYVLYDTTRGGGVRTFNAKKAQTVSTTTEFEDNDNNWTKAEFDNALFDNAALDAHSGVENTYDYFLSVHGRNSYNGNGTLLRSYVHYGNAYENAGWTGSEMVYGDGASTFNVLTAFDVTAHELGHGVCSSSANLIYSRESGALNEGFSDIWGAAAEAKYAPTKQRWLIGEDIVKVAPGYLRSMSNPKSSYGGQPDTYRGIGWKAATVEEGCATPNSQLNDNCGVHYNSGVLNHWFYILSEGKAGTNDKGNVYNVTGITIEKAEKIAYRLETNYLTPSSNYKNARDFGIQTAKDLYGADSPEAIATQDAFYAVGVGVKYLSTPDVTAPTVPSSLVASNTTGTQTKLTWNASTDENGVDRYVIFKNGVQETATVQGNLTTTVVTGLTVATPYTFYIKAVDAYDNISAASNTVNITTLNTPTYCTATSTNTADEKIKRVQLGTIDNSSTGTAGYEDFSYISTDVEKGSPYTITITPDWAGTNYSEGYAVYVDWNNDGDFSDANETAFTKAASTTTPVTGVITVPVDAPSIGNVRMRVILRFNAIATACGSFTYGQVEDYTLNVKNKDLAVSELNSTTTSIYPNPVKDYMTVQSKVSGEFSYKIYNTAGQIAQSGKSSDKKINAAKLPVGNYIMELTDKSGATMTTKFIKK